MSFGFRGRWRVQWAGLAPRRDLAVALLLGGLLATAGPAGLAAQEARGGAPVQRGDRVRVRGVGSLVWTVGEVVRLTRDTLELSVNDEARLVLPLDTLFKLEVSRGHSPRLLEGALAGAAAGGFVAGVTLDCESVEFCGFERTVSVAVGALAGSLAGVLVGSLSEGEDWERVPLRAVRDSAAPQAGNR